MMLPLTPVWVKAWYATSNNNASKHWIVTYGQSTETKQGEVYASVVTWFVPSRTRTAKTSPPNWKTATGFIEGFGVLKQCGEEIEICRPEPTSVDD